MAKFCINCGKKIGFMDDSFRLQHSDEVFCADCMEEPKALLEDIKNVISVERYKDVKEKFERDIDVCRLPEKVKKYIQYDFDCIAQEAMEYLISLGTEESFASIYRFSAGFQESFDAVVEVGKKIGDSGASIVKPYVITAGEGKIATFVFESYFLRTGSYASLTVTLVNYQGVSTLTVIGSGGGDGLFNISWGAEGDFAADFWTVFRSTYPQYVLEKVFGAEDDASEIMGEKGLHNSVSAVKTKRKIGILGGTFDPIHLGHVSLAKGAIKAGQLNKLIIMPAKVQPFKLGNLITDDIHRLAMAKAAFEGDDRIEVSDFEIKNTTISYTYDTLIALKEIYPEDELYFILGTDSFLEVEYWHKGSDLLRQFHFIVGNRPGYRQSELEHKIEQYKTHYQTETIIVSDQMPDISSTAIRERVRMELPVSHLLPEKVERYINENRLYP